MKTWKQAFTGILAVIALAFGFTALSLTGCDNGNNPETGGGNKNPAATDYLIGNVKQTANKVTAVTVTPKSGKSSGERTVYYNGSQAIPQTVGSYALTFDVAAATGWNAAKGLSAGTLEVNNNQTPAPGHYTFGNLEQAAGSVSPVTITKNSGASPGAVVNIKYSGSAALPQTGGTYAVTFDVEAATGWNEAANLPAGNLVVTGSGGSAVPGATLAAKLAWLKTNAQSGEIYTLEVSANETLAPQTLSYSGKTNVTVILKGTGGVKTVTLSADGSIFTVEKNVTLVLDENITLRDIEMPTTTESYYLVTVNGALVMNAGSKIIGIQNRRAGGVEMSGTFTMNGGEISGFNYYSSGVYVSGGTFTMNGGKISGNHTQSSSDSGGVFITYKNDSYGSFTMNGGEISGNSARTGGGVFLYVGTFTIYDGKISDNSGVNGGGVYVYDSLVTSFTMNGGEISGNTARDDGGGVCGPFTMNGGKIFGNDASYGGGVMWGPLTMNGGEISGNTAGHGGGVNGTLTMNGGTISGNTATYSNTITGSGNGGGVSGSLTINSGTISGNTAANDGGGVYVGSVTSIGYYYGRCVMRGGTISGNTASNESSSSYGGGVFVGNYGIFDMEDGTISGNDIGVCVGSYYGGSASKTFNMKGGTISGNGLGVHVYYGTFNMFDGVISGNTGGGMRLDQYGVFHIITGIIYGTDEADPALQNTAENGGAALRIINSGGPAQYGTFSGETWFGDYSDTTWNSNGNLSNTDNTIKVVDGELITP